MVEVGSLQIGGSINTEEIERGLDRVERGLGDVQSESKSVNSDFERMHGLSKSLALTLTGMGVAGMAALTAMATGAPAVAPALAKMNVEWTKMSHAVGRDLAPIFNEIAYTLLPAVGDALEALPLETWATRAAEDIRDIAGALQHDLDSIKNLIPEASMMALGAAAGFAALGPKGLFLGAALGYAVGEAIEPEVTPAQRAEFGDFAESAALAQQLAGWGETHANLYEEEGITGILRSFPQFVGLNLNVGLQGIFDTIQWLMGSSNQRERDFSTRNGVHYL